MNNKGLGIKHENCKCRTSAFISGDGNVWIVDIPPIPLATGRPWEWHWIYWDYCRQVQATQNWLGIKMQMQKLSFLRGNWGCSVPQENLAGRRGREAGGGAAGVLLSLVDENWHFLLQGSLMGHSFPTGECIFRNKRHSPKLKKINDVLITSSPPPDCGGIMACPLLNLLR